MLQLEMRVFNKIDIVVSKLLWEFDVVFLDLNSYFLNKFLKILKAINIKNSTNLSLCDYLGVCVVIDETTKTPRLYTANTSEGEVREVFYEDAGQAIN